MTFISMHSVIICVVLPWRTYEMHPALSLKSGCDTGSPNFEQFSGLLTSKFPTSTSTSPSRTGGLVDRLHDRRPGRWGDGRRNDSVFAHRPKARRTAVAPTSATTLHRRLERLQSAFHR